MFLTRRLSSHLRVSLELRNILVQNAPRYFHRLSSRYVYNTSGENTMLRVNVQRLFSNVSSVLFCNKDTDTLDTSENLYIKDAKSKLYHHPGSGHNIFLIQPRIKNGPKRETKPRCELKMEEATTLVKTLPNWTVVHKIVLPVADMNSKFIFGKGNLENIKMMIHSHPQITAIFIGINILKSVQIATLENVFHMQVFDRYQVILQIFHDHAHTKEAKLQLALAEIPYLRVKLTSFSHTWNTKTFQGMEHVGGSGETIMETRRRILSEREMKLKKELEKVREQREVLRRSEIRCSLPIVAIVGYTNCGKTTLIKSLTDDARLIPEDKLFATLDVTLHQGFLPSQQKVLFIDTVGFISDVPTALIQSFRSTLEEINLADLVVHVRDISHPDAEMQRDTVLQTLRELDLPPKLLDSIVEVNNKVDLLEDPASAEGSGAISISATEGTGLSDFLDTVEQKLFENTGHKVTLLRIPNGGDEYSWLMRETSIRDWIADPKDSNHLIVEVVMSSANLGRFKHRFGDLSVTVESLSQ